MKKVTILIIALCLSLAFIASAENIYASDDIAEEEYIDFSFCAAAVTREEYALIETDYPRAELNLIHFKYLNFEGEEQEGEMIVNQHIAFDVLFALEDIFKAGYPLEEPYYFVCDGFDVAFTAPPFPGKLEDDPYNQIFGQFDFAWNENQAEGAHHYTIEHKISEWYPNNLPTN